MSENTNTIRDLMIKKGLAERDDINLNFYSPDEESLKNSFLSKTFNYCIPLGFNCGPAQALQSSNIRIRKLPFDWMQASFYNYCNMIIDMYNNTLDLEIKQNVKNINDVEHFIPKYNAWMPHEKTNSINEIQSNYTKYFKRLKNILDHPKNANKFDICIMIMSMPMQIESVEVTYKYKDLLLELFPNNNYYFLTVNIGDAPFVKDDHINLINHRTDGIWNNKEWIGGQNMYPVMKFVEKHVICSNSGVDLDNFDNNEY